MQTAIWMVLAAGATLLVGGATAGNAALFISGAAIFLLSIFSCARRWEWLTVVDVYVFFIGIFFGALSMIDATLNDLALMNPYVIFLVHIHIGGLTALILSFHLMLPARVQQAIRVEVLLRRLVGAKVWPLIAIAVFAVFFKIYGYLKFGIISGMPWDYLSRNAVQLPYWYTSTIIIADLLITFAFCGAMARFLMRPGRMRYLWIGVIMIALIFEAIDSRRGLFYLLVLGGGLWGIARKVNPFIMRYLWAWVAAGLFLFSASNVFQTYRFLLFNPMLRDAIQDVSFLDAMLNGEATISNLRGREATWRFNYRIFESQLKNPARFLPFGMYGRMTAQALRNSVPRKLLPDKQVVQAEDLASAEYGLLVEDYSGNIFANMAADWGFLSVIFVPLVFLALTLTYYVLCRIRIPGEAMPGLLLVGILGYFLRVESSVDDFYVLYRNLFLVGVIYYCFELVWNAAGGRMEPARAGGRSSRRA